MADPESLVRFAELLKLRSLAASTQVGYLKALRLLVERVGGDPAGLDEAEVRAHVLHLLPANSWGTRFSEWRMA